MAALFCGSTCRVAMLLFVLRRASCTQRPAFMLGLHLGALRAWHVCQHQSSRDVLYTVHFIMAL